MRVAASSHTLAAATVTAIREYFRAERGTTDGRNVMAATTTAMTSAMTKTSFRPWTLVKMSIGEKLKAATLTAAAHSARRSRKRPNATTIAATMATDNTRLKNTTPAGFTPTARSHHPAVTTKPNERP